MKCNHLLPGNIRILRYQAILCIVFLLLLSAISMFSSNEQSWKPYTIALTFDDGPHPFYTYKLIDICNRYNVKVTFFLVGKQIDKYPDLAKTIIQNGHEIGNHTYNHYNLTKISPQEVLSEINKTHLASLRACDQAPRWFRPPGGHHNKRIIQLARSIGYSLALWDYAPFDHVEQPPDILFNKIINNTSDGNIILLHSGINATLANLPRIIEHFQARGFKFITVSESMALKNQLKKAYF